VSQDRSIRGKIAVAGVGETPYYKHGESPEPEFKMALEAILNVGADAGNCRRLRRLYGRVPRPGAGAIPAFWSRGAGPDRLWRQCVFSALWGDVAGAALRHEGDAVYA